MENFIGPLILLCVVLVFGVGIWVCWPVPTEEYSRITLPSVTTIKSYEMDEYQKILKAEMAQMKAEYELFGPRNIVTPFPFTQEKIMSSCSAKETITELRLAALEAGVPIDPNKVIDAALVALQTRGQKTKTDYNGGYNMGHSYTAVGTGLAEAIALLEFVQTLAARETP